MLVSSVPNDVSFHMDISRIINSDPINRWIFANSGTDTFIVGGYIRDLLLGNISKDRDFVLQKNAKETAIRFADKFSGTYIEFKKYRTYRVVINKEDFVDFNNLDRNIYHDLNQRDFSLNAMAWSPLTGLIDPLNGNSDLVCGVIRAVNHHNLLKDPLRLLRAYRIAAHLGFRIDRNTRRYLKKYSKEISTIATERITDEMFKLLNVNAASEYLKICYEDNLLNRIIAINDQNFTSYLEQLINYDLFIKRLKKYGYKGITRKSILYKLEKGLGQGLKVDGFIKLALLLLNSRGGALKNIRLLKMSKLLTSKLSNIINSHKLIAGRLTDRKLFNIYTASGSSVFETSLIMSLNNKRNMRRFINRAEDFMKLQENCILSGHEIENLLNILPSAKIGEIKREIIGEQFSGFIKNKRDARQWIISNLT